MSRAERESRRNGEIDFLRFVFALIIVLHHTRYLLGDEKCLFLGGSLGVEFFFVVSGYLLMNTVARRAGLRTLFPAAGAAGEERTAGGGAPAREILSGKMLLSGAFLGTETAAFLRRKLAGICPEFPIAWGVGFIFVSAARELSGAEMLRMLVRDFWELTLLKMTGLFTGGFDGVIWYVSAMLLCMAVLYPLLRVHTDFMMRIGAPLTALLLLGYLCRSFDHPRDPAVWLGFCYKGVVRAMAELCLGIALFPLVQRLKERTLSRSARLLLSLTAWGSCLAVIWYMYAEKPSRSDFFFLFLLCGVVAVSFSGQDLAAPRLRGPVFSFLAKLSTALYFSHIYYAQNLNRVLPDAMGDAARTAVYLFCSFATALLVLAASEALRRRSGRLRERKL